MRPLNRHPSVLRLIFWSCLPVLGALLGGAQPAPGADAPAAAPPSSVAAIGEGEWILYKGNLQAQQRREEESESLNMVLEVAYLGLGSKKPSGEDAEVLLLRMGESPDENAAAVAEAVSLVADPARGLVADLPIQDRGTRVSPLLFKFLPLSIFPARADLPGPAENQPARQGAGKTAIHVLFLEEKELKLTRRVEPDAATGPFSISVTAEPGQRVSFLQDRVEVPFEIARLEKTYRLAPSKTARRFDLLSFESRLEGKFPGEELSLRIELTRSGVRTIEGAAWKQLQAEARALQEIERMIFQKLDPEGARVRVQTFEKEHPSGRLGRYAVGLGLQAENVWEIARERRLYGKTAPDFTLKDLGGKDVTLSKILPGKITLLSFWGVG